MTGLEQGGFSDHEGYTIDTDRDGRGSERFSDRQGYTESLQRTDRKERGGLLEPQRYVSQRTVIVSDQIS